MKLGNNIQYLRRQRRMAQEQLAEVMEVSRQTVSRWEADEDDHAEPGGRRAGLSGRLGEAGVFTSFGP